MVGGCGAALVYRPAPGIVRTRRPRMAARGRHGQTRCAFYRPMDEMPPPNDGMPPSDSGVGPPMDEMPPPSDGMPPSDSGVGAADG